MNNCRQVPGGASGGGRRRRRQRVH